MGQKIFGWSSRYELLAGHEADTGKTIRRFLDRDEALRFLRQSASDPADMDALRRWLFDEGLVLWPEQDLLERVATALSAGLLRIGFLDYDSVGAGAGGKEEPPEPKPTPEPKPKPKPVTVAELLVNVKDADGKPVEDATVTAGALGTMKTDKNGVADYGKVTPGTYDVTAEKSGHAPKRNDTEPKKDEKKDVSVPDGKKTVVDLVQHPQCANVAFFEGSSPPRENYFGFDHKTNIIAAANGEYWKPVPDKGTLTMPGNKFVRNASRWVSVATGEETEVEINFDFKGGECIPCIANSTFEVVPATIADVVTTSITAKKAKFRIKGKAVGEASLKVRCDGKDIGWFHIWCKTKAKIVIDVANIVTARAPAVAYDIAALGNVMSDVFRQAVLEVEMRDLGAIDLTGNAAATAIENPGYPAPAPPAAGPVPFDPDATAVLNGLHGLATASLAARPLGEPKPLGAYRLYFYVPVGGAGGVLGDAVSIGNSFAFMYVAGTDTANNVAAHEFGHCLNLEHPRDNSPVTQFPAHNHATLGTAVPAYDATNTEPASATLSPGRNNVMANDPTNLMSYWPDRPNRKPLRYHQWLAAKRS